MVDENRVKLMTRLAIYEKHEGNRNLVMSKYYKKDYVRYQVLKTWVASTVVYWAVIGSYIFMKFEDLLAGINDMDYFDIMYRMLAWYVVFCLAYFFFATILYSYRYAKAKPGLVEYNSNLKDLIELEGGAMHHAKAVSEDDTMMRNTQETVEEKDTVQSSRGSVSRSAIVNQRLAEGEKQKEEEILENIKRRNARLAEKERQARQLEEDRRRIQERRRLLERQEMERRRKLRQEQMERERYTDYGNSDDEGSGR